MQAKQDTNNKVKSKEGINQSGSTRRRGCISEFLLVKGVRLVGGVWVSPRRPTQRHKGLTLFSDELRHKGLVHLPLLESLKAESGAFTKGLRHTPTTELGALKHTTNLLQQQHTSKNQWCLGFLHKETLGKKSLKWMRGKWRTAWWRCGSGPSPSILQRSTHLGGRIGRNLRFGELK